jgi:hypothetical protein
MPGREICRDWGWEADRRLNCGPHLNRFKEIMF